MNRVGRPCIVSIVKRRCIAFCEKMTTMYLSHFAIHCDFQDCSEAAPILVTGLQTCLRLANSLLPAQSVLYGYSSEIRKSHMKVRYTDHAKNSISPRFQEWDLGVADCVPSESPSGKTMTIQNFDSHSTISMSQLLLVGAVLVLHNV